MKKNLYIAGLLLMLTLIVSSCATTTQSQKQAPVPEKAQFDVKSLIVGEWVDEDLKYLFAENGYATLFMGNQVMGGYDLFKESALKYVIDETKDPMTLDLIHIDTTTEKVRKTMPMLLKFVNNDKIMIRSFLSDKRPEKFEGEDDEFTLTLIRKTDSTDK